MERIQLRENGTIKTSLKHNTDSVIEYLSGFDAPLTPAREVAEPDPH